MEQPFQADYIAKVLDIDYFLASDLNSDYPASSERSSFPSYDHDLNFCFENTAESENSNHGLGNATKKILKMHIDKKRYQSISNELRLELIDAVRNRKEKIKYAAKRLGINYSSAKYICQVYKKEGRKDKIIFKRKSGKDEISEPIQNGTIYTSPTSSVFSTHGDPSTFYFSNAMIPQHSFAPFVTEDNREHLQTSGEVTTEKEKLVISNAPQRQYQPQNNSFPLNSSHNQNSAIMSLTPSAANGICLSTPSNYLLSYPAQSLNAHQSSHVQINPTMAVWSNNTHPYMQSNPMLSQNVLPGQSQIYPVNYPIHGVNQFPNASFTHLPVYTCIPPAAHTQTASAQPVQALFCFIGNPQSLPINTAHNPIQ